MNNLRSALHLNGSSFLAICGAGGKTSLLYALAEEYRADNAAVALSTSTHMLQPENTYVLSFHQPHSPDEMHRLLRPGHITALGTPCAQKKIAEPESAIISCTRSLADCFVYEADGAHRLPLKCHNRHEPQIWFGTHVVIGVLGLSALGKPADMVCHRPDLDAVFRMNPHKCIDTDDFVRLALECRSAAGFPANYRVCLNQCDDEAAFETAQQIAAELSAYDIRCTATCLLPNQELAIPL